MDILPLVIQVVLGAGAGVLMGKLFSRMDEGLVVNAAIGVAGGLVCAQVLGAMVGAIVPSGNGPDIAYIITSIVASMLGGAAALVIAGSVGRGPMART